MTLKKLFFLIFIVLITTTLRSQTEEEYYVEWRSRIDKIVSLDSKIKYSKEILPKVDSLYKMEVYNEISTSYFGKKKKDSALFFCNQGIAIGEHLGLKELRLWSLYAQKAYLLIELEREKEALLVLEKVRRLLKEDPDNKSWIDYYASYELIASKNMEFYKSLKYADSSITILKIIGDTFHIPTKYNQKAKYYFNLGNFEEATRNLLYAIELREKQENPKGLEINYFNLGCFYSEWGKYKRAVKYFEKSISRANEVGKKLVTFNAMSEMARAYRKMKDHTNAIKIIDSILNMAKSPENDVSILEALREKGWVYLRNLKQYDKAEQYFIKSHEMTLATTPKDINLYSSYRALTELYIKKRAYKKAKKYLNLLEGVTNKLNSQKRTERFHKVSKEYYEETGQYVLAMKHYKRYYAIRDSIFNNKIKIKIADLEKKYDTKKKELAIVNLNKEKEEQQLVVQKAKNRQILYLLAAGFLLVLLILGAWAFRKLRKQQKELLATNQVKNRLFSIIAHDLRGMIIPFQRSGKILKHHIDKGNHQKTIELSQALEKNSEGLSNMLDNLLNWSLEQMNGYKMQAENIFVSEELSKIIEGYGEQTAYKKTRIELKYIEDVSIYMDKGAFHVIFRNLIGNALKYTEEGSIRIEFKKENSLFLCSVIDTGIGMNPEQLENLFTLEEKKSTIGTQGEKGTGLGLNLVYRFVKMHKGTIDVSSEKRIGTRFEMKIPITISLYKEEGEVVSESLSV